MTTVPNPMTLDQLLAIPDRALSSIDATLLLDQIDAWCAAHNVAANEFGRMACDFGGWVGLLRLRGTARTRMAALARQLITLHPHGVAPGERDRLRQEAYNLLFQLRIPDPMRKLRPSIPGCSAPTSLIDNPRAMPIVARDPCMRCGTRADIGCTHRRPSALAA